MDGKLIVSVGSSRSGKSAYVVQQVKNDKRVIVWNEKDNKNDLSNYDERNGFQRVYKKTDLIRLIKQNPEGPLRVCYVPTKLTDFDWWARLAYAWGRVKKCTVIAEELSDVTTPAKAPQGWGMVCRKLLGYGCNIYAITQRPSESDKTSIGNATMLHCGRLQRDGDRAYMAKEMNIDKSIIDNLKPLEWAESYADGRTRTGKLTF